MLSKEIFKSIIAKANDNIYDLVFQGNFLFAYHGTSFILQKQGVLNPYDIDTVEFIPVSEISSTEIAFTEVNNRSDFTKIYEFAFPSDVENVPEALQDLRDYYFANQSVSIVDGGITYAGTIKISRPNKSRELLNAQSGRFIMIYTMQISLSVYDSAKGYDSNLATITIDGVDMPYTNFVKGTALVLDPSNKVTAKANTSKKPYGQGVGGTMTLVYDRSAAMKKVYKACDGNETNQTRTTTFTIVTTVDGITSTVTAYIWGNISYAPNNVILLNCVWTEA